MCTNRQPVVFLHTGLDKAELSFSSQAQYLMINEASVSWLVDKVSDDSADFEKDTAIHRFRGNIIVGGCGAFDETQWEHVRIGNDHFKVCINVCTDMFVKRYV